MNPNNTSSNNFAPMPTKRKKRWIRYVFLLLLLLAAAAGVWACLQMMEKGEVVIPLPEKLAEQVQNSLDLPDGKLGPVRFGQNDDHGLSSSSISTGPVEVSGMFVQNPEMIGSGEDSPTISEESGTLEDRIDYLAMSEEEALLLAELPESPEETREKITSGEDRVVTLNFVDDLAATLVENYWPQGSHPAAVRRDVSSLSIKTLNQRYGLDLKGMAGNSSASSRDFFSDRATILNYAFNPTMLQALTHLYSDRFLDAMQDHASSSLPGSEGGSRTLSKQDQGRMFRLYAAQFKAVGSALNAYASNPSIAEEMSSYREAMQSAYAINGRYLDALHYLESVQESSDVSVIRQAREEADKLGSAYQTALQKQGRIRDDVVSLMRAEGASLDAESLVYIASWASRRVQEGNAGLSSAASCLNWVAEAMQNKAESLR